MTKHGGEFTFFDNEFLRQLGIGFSLENANIFSDNGQSTLPFPKKKTILKL